MTMKTKTQKEKIVHTPGPWTVQPCQWDQGASLVICAASHVLAKIEPINDDGDEVDANNAVREPDDYANAALMAAAPDLLEACKQIVWKLSHNHADGIGPDAKTWPGTINRNDITVKMAEAAIAKALEVKP